jgi:hypothetical protein
VFADDELHHDGPYTGGGLFSLLPSPAGLQEVQMEPLTPRTPDGEEGTDLESGVSRSASMSRGSSMTDMQ